MGGIKRLFLFFETLYLKKRQKLPILWQDIAKIGTSGASQASKASSWFFSWFTQATELLVLAFLMKILPVFGGFRDKPIKNVQKIKITDVLGNRKNYDSNLNDTYSHQLPIYKCLYYEAHFLSLLTIKCLLTKISWKFWFKNKGKENNTKEPSQSYIIPSIICK